MNKCNISITYIRRPNVAFARLPALLSPRKLGSRGSHHGTVANDQSQSNNETPEASPQARGSTLHAWRPAHMCETQCGAMNSKGSTVPRAHNL